MCLCCIYIEGKWSRLARGREGDTECRAQSYVGKEGERATHSRRSELTRSTQIICIYLSRIVSFPHFFPLLKMRSEFAEHDFSLAHFLYTHRTNTESRYVASVGKPFLFN